MLATGLVVGSPSSIAYQGLSLDSSINSVDECGIALPVATLRDELRKALRAQAPGGIQDCIEVWSDFEAGDDDTSSEDDTLVLGGRIWHVGILGIPCSLLVATVEAKIKFIPGQTSLHPNPDDLLVYRKQVAQDYWHYDRIYAFNLVANGLLDGQGHLIPE